MVAALRRFIARRGIPSQIVSDNATNFVGARRDLNELEKMAKAGAQSYSSIEWLFIPPRSPNFGGLWEAAVKSMKHHLRRIMCNSILTYEEITTILCQIEQVLNNRPLMALTNNPDDNFALTPSMLVNGSRLDSIPQPCLQKMDARGHPAKRFRALQQLLSQFWKRWSTGLLEFESATVLFLVSLSIYSFTFKIDQSLCLTAITLLISCTIFTTHCSLL